MRFRRWNAWPERELSADPGELPLGIAPGVAFCMLGSLFGADFVAHKARKPWQAVRFHRRQLRIEPAFDQPAGLVHCAHHHHALKAPVDPRIQARARRGQRNPQPLPFGQKRRFRCRLKIREPLAGRKPDLIGPCKSLTVIGGKALCSDRIDSLQAEAQPFRPLSQTNSAHIAAHIFRHRRNLTEPLDQGQEIKPCAADEDWHASAPLDICQNGPRIGKPLAGRIARRSIDMTEKMVRNSGFLVRIGPRGQHTQVAINLHGIGIDDLAIKGFCQFDGKFGLAAGGRAVDEKGRAHPVSGYALLANVKSKDIKVMTDTSESGMLAAVAVTVNDAGIVETDLAGVLESVAGEGAKIRKLSPDGENLAIEAVFTPSAGVAAQDLHGQIAAALGARADIAVLPAQGRRKRLLICDMDSTVIGQECLDELADFAGLKTQVAEITERAMRGELDFEGALTTRVAMLAGLDLSALTRCFDERISLNPGARTLVATMKANGARCVLVSGGFSFFTRRVAAAAGFDADRGNTLIDDGAHLTGAVGHPILGREAKLEALLTESNGLGGPQAVLAIGDGANDLAMIAAAGLGLAYRAKPVVAAQADASIALTDLRTALYFQGYCAGSIVEAG